jgi:hypothetical protein
MLDHTHEERRAAPTHGRICHRRHTRERHGGHPGVVLPRQPGATAPLTGQDPPGEDSRGNHAQDEKAFLSTADFDGTLRQALPVAQAANICIIKLYLYYSSFDSHPAGTPVVYETESLTYESNGKA